MAARLLTGNRIHLLFQFVDTWDRPVPRVKVVAARIVHFSRPGSTNLFWRKKMSLRFVSASFFSMVTLVLSTVFASSSLQAACETEQSALSSCLQRASGCQNDLECGSGRTCEEGQCVRVSTCPAVTCIRTCSDWIGSGSNPTCMSWGNYCDRQPSCQTSCSEWIGSGANPTCMGWEDVCSSGAPASCQ